MQDVVERSQVEYQEKQCSKYLVQVDQCKDHHRAVIMQGLVMLLVVMVTASLFTTQMQNMQTVGYVALGVMLCYVAVRYVLDVVQATRDVAA